MNPKIEKALKNLQKVIDEETQAQDSVEQSFTIFMTEGMIKQSMVVVTEAVRAGDMAIETPFILKFPQINDVCRTQAVTSTIRIQERARFTRLFEKTSAKDGASLTFTKEVDGTWTVRVGNVRDSKKMLKRRKSR